MAEGLGLPALPTLRPAGLDQGPDGRHCHWDCQRHALPSPEAQLRLLRVQYSSRRVLVFHSSGRRSFPAACPSVCPCVFPSVLLPFHLCVCPHVRLFARLSVCPCAPPTPDDWCASGLCAGVLRMGSKPNKKRGLPSFGGTSLLPSQPQALRHPTPPSATLRHSPQCVGASPCEPGGGWAARRGAGPPSVSFCRAPWNQTVIL